jgi:hypothetical protein
MTDSGQNWHAVKEKCFALASKLTGPTFFLTITMNAYWPEYQSLKRGRWHFSDGTMASIIVRARTQWLMKFCRTRRTLGTVRGFAWRIEYQQRGLPHAHILFWKNCDMSDTHEIDRIINTRDPLPSTIENENDMARGFRTLIDRYQVHQHTPRCEIEKNNRKCKYGYRQPEGEKTSISRYLCQFARRAEDVNVVPHSPEIMNEPPPEGWRRHRDLMRKITIVWVLVARYVAPHRCLREILGNRTE